MTPTLMPELRGLITVTHALTANEPVDAMFLRTNTVYTTTDIFSSNSTE